jgi:hypothetical protein
METKYPDPVYYLPKLLSDAFKSHSKRSRTTTYTDFIAKRKKVEKRRKQRKITRQHKQRFGK